jgi:hypothetical protein
MLDIVPPFSKPEAAGLSTRFGRAAWTGRAWCSSAASKPAMEAEVALNLHDTLDQLVWLRSGDSPRAISHMERRLDAAIVGLKADRAVSDLSNPAREALLAAKICREAFPYDRAWDPARGSRRTSPKRFRKRCAPPRHFQLLIELCVDSASQAARAGATSGRRAATAIASAERVMVTAVLAAAPRMP